MDKKLLYIYTKSDKKILLKPIENDDFSIFLQIYNINSFWLFVPNIVQAIKSGFYFCIKYFLYFLSKILSS